MPRHKIEFNENEISNYAKLGASNCEIAHMLGCDEGTIRKRFSELLQKSRASRKIKLRQLQWALAEKGNLGMAIWLGKQELGQVERVETKNEHTGADGQALELVHVNITLPSNGYEVKE